MNGTSDQDTHHRRAFFHDEMIVSNDRMEENLSTNSNQQDENPTNKSFKRKAVSFSAMPSEKKVADGKFLNPGIEFSSNLFLVCDCLRYMQEGSDFLKVRSYARQFRRLYKLNETFTTISWTPTTKKPSKAMSNSSDICLRDFRLSVWI